MSSESLLGALKSLKLHGMAQAVDELARQGAAAFSTIKPMLADEWQSVDTLRAMCAVRDDSVARMHWNGEGTMFVGRILVPLRWFGLVEYRGPEVSSEVGWRKTVLFDRFLSFDVQFAERHPEGLLARIRHRRGGNERGGVSRVGSAVGRTALSGTAGRGADRR